MRISEEYKKLNEDLHNSSEHYGTSGKKYFKEILELSTSLGTTDILDYGCGKGTLANHLPFSIKQYDPAVEKYSSDPEAADIVVCTDVLEHIEPELLDNVLDHIKSKTKKVSFFIIHNELALKTLNDGRNAHLIVEKPAWWINKLSEYFDVWSFMKAQNQSMIICGIK